MFDGGVVFVMDVKGLTKERSVLWLFNVWRRNGLCYGC